MRAKGLRTDWDKVHWPKCGARLIACKPSIMVLAFYHSKLYFKERKKRYKRTIRAVWGSLKCA